jgi:hypothetical protein
MWASQRITRLIPCQSAAPIGCRLLLRLGFVVIVQTKSKAECGGCRIFEILVVQSSAEIDGMEQHCPANGTVFSETFKTACLTNHFQDGTTSERNKHQPSHQLRLRASSMLSMLSSRRRQCFLLSLYYFSLLIKDMNRPLKEISFLSQLVCYYCFSS